MERKAFSSLLVLGIPAAAVSIVAVHLFAGSKLYRIFQASLASLRKRIGSDDDEDDEDDEDADDDDEDQSSVHGSLELWHTDTVVSPDNPTQNYRVFFSFTGEESSFKFCDHVYHALRRAGIVRYEEQIQVGDEIIPARYSVIEQSRILIIVFSRDYASSTRCLDELVKILECKKEKKHVVLPIFYKVHPREVRRQSHSFKKAMVRHEKNYKANIEKVQKWRSALHEAANLTGQFYKKDMGESNFIDSIIQKISSCLDHSLLHLPEHAVGLECRISRVTSLLSVGSEDVDMVGIYGFDGIGKTTIAKAVYNSIAEQFERTIFCTDVRESIAKNGLDHIRGTIKCNMLGRKDINSSEIHADAQAMIAALQTKRVLLVLDNVDEISQLESLAGNCDWFGAGSVVIITTRNKQLLSTHGIQKIYEVEELDKKKALELLCWNAFRNNQPSSEFDDILDRVLHYAQGIPLALKEIGFHFYGKDRKECESAMDAYETTMKKNIFDNLKGSYEGLEYNEKEIFLDVAFFWKGYSLEDVEEFIKARGFSSEFGLSTLEDRCLVKRQGPNLLMHDLVRRVAREIVRRESEKEPGERSRIWFHRDALQVLTKNTGTSKVQGIILDLPQRQEVRWSGEALKKMPNLQILIIRNAVLLEVPKELPKSLRVIEWEDSPSSSLRYFFKGNEPAELRLTNSPQIMQLEEPFKESLDETEKVELPMEGPVVSEESVNEDSSDRS